MLENDLNKFRKAYPSIRMTQYEEYLVYSVAPNYGKRAAERASTLIAELGLALIAEPTTLFKQDSFTIKQKQ